MRHDEQQRVERMDGGSSFLYATCRLMASDGYHGISYARPVLRQIETAEAARLRADRVSTAARTPDAASVGGVQPPTAR